MPPDSSTNLHRRSSQSQVCELDQMLAEYYADRSWNQGVAPEEKLNELDIK